MAQRLIEVAKRRPKRNRGGHAKHPWPDAAVDESPFAHVTADMIVRARDAQPFKLPSPVTDSSNDEDHKSRFLGSTAGLLVYKGEAEASVIEAHPGEANDRTDAIAARREADEERRRLRNELAALKATLADREAALAQAVLDAEQPREDPQESETEAQLREQSARALADMRAQAEAARDRADEEIHSLRDELAALRSTLADRETALAQAVLDHEQARTRWQVESEAALSNAEQAWKSAEAAHLAETEAQGRKQSAQALAELRAQAEAARDQADGHIRGLRDELSALQSTLADREAALAQAALDHERARTSWQQDSQAALTNAEQAWKAAEAARLAEAEAKWQEHSAGALAALRADAEAARASADGTIRALQDQVAAVQAMVAEREAALAQAASETERVREHGRQELASALAQAKAWQADEAQRLATAEARWRTQSAGALAEAQARYQAAEGMLTQLRMQADRARSEAVGGSIRSGEQRATFGAKPPAREAEPAPIRLPTREARGQGAKDSQIVIQPHRILQEQDPRASRKRGGMRDIVVVALIAVAVIVAYPRIEPLIPEPWRSNIAALIGGFGPSQNVAAPGSASVDREVNLRVGPSTTADIIGTLPRGMRVATIARRDEWTLVEIDADSRNTQPRRGWVYSAYLRNGTSTVEDDFETAPSEDSE